MNPPTHHPEPAPDVRRSGVRRSGHRLRPLALAAACALVATACGEDAADGNAAEPTEARAATGTTETDADTTTDTAADATTGAGTTATTEADATTTGADADTATTEPPATEETDPVPDDATVTLVAYDSFPEEETSLNEALAEFSADTGIEVELLLAGDTGTMLSKAELTAGNPEGDVMWGIDNTFLSRAIEAEIFEPYEPDGVDAIRDDLVALVPEHEATPVDYGDVCVNYDIGWFEEAGLEPPTSLDDLTDPAYADLLVAQNPATSSPGLAFLLATIDEFGEEGWQDYWTALDENGVEIVDGWTEAYYSRFTWAGGGPKPIVVSYGSSPPAEVIFAEPPRDDAPTGVIDSTCFRQVEFAGVLRGTDQPEAARALVDFLISDEFQAELPLNLFVYPANAGTSLPPEFVEHAVIPDESRSVAPATIDAQREAWIDQWTSLVLA